MRRFLFFAMSFVTTICMFAQNNDSQRLLGDINNSGDVNIADISALTELILNNQVVYIKPDTVYVTVHDTILIEDGHGYVDLGLSVRWATTNLGAEESYDYGKYYAWGETSAYNEAPSAYPTDWTGSTNSNYLSLNKKTEYSYKYYKWGTGILNLYKYNFSESRGPVDNTYTLESIDDAARANWGGAWRIPTDTEFTELRNKCTWEWTTLKGTNGYKVTGPNGKSIFLPAAGKRVGNDLMSDGSLGAYSTSNINPTYSYTIYEMYFYSSRVGRDTTTPRYYGLSIRPVLPKKQ